MTIDASAKARVVGASATFKDLRSGSAPFLPQRVMLLGQGATASTFSLDKFLATSAYHVGSILGFKSPAYHAALELLPAIGTIPLTVYPMADNGSGVVATGDITPSGTATVAAAYRVRIGGILSTEYTIPLGAVDVTRACAEIRKSINAVVGMPVTVSHTYGSVSRTIGGGNTGDGTLTAMAVNGTPLPGDYVLTCTAAATDAGTFKLVDPDGTVVSTTIEVTGSTVTGGGIDMTLTDGTADFVIGDVFTITVPATDVKLTSAWKGVSANDISLSVVGDTTLGVTHAFTAMNGGLVNPTVDAALLLMGDVWETMVLSTLDDADATALNAIKVKGESQWGDTVRKPYIAFRGNTESDRGNATVVTAARTDDRINCQLVAPGSPNMPHVIAARQLALIVKKANNAPANDYGSERATGLIAGADSVQWNYTVRDQALKAGSSTITVKDGVINISDVVTHWAPSGEPDPAYRYVVDIIKIQQIFFQIDLKFANSEWDGAPLIKDDQVTSDPTAKKPKMAKQEIFDIIDSLAGGNAAILADPEAIKKTVTAVHISSKRINLGADFQISGNANIIDFPFNWGFFTG